MLESLRVVEEHGLVLELPCVFPRHLGDLPELARRFPGLTIVIDHLGKPPLGSEQMGDWSALLRRAAELPNVCAKVSGLNTMLASPGVGGVPTCGRRSRWRSTASGPTGCMCGSDWPVSLLNGDYAKVWRETVAAITIVAGDAAARRILEDTPARLYGLAEATGAVSTTDHRSSPWSRSLTRRSRRSRI